MAIRKNDNGGFQVYVGNHEVYHQVAGFSGEGQIPTTYTEAVSQLINHEHGPIVTCESCFLLMSKGSDKYHLHNEGYYLCVDCHNQDPEVTYHREQTPTTFPDTCLPR